MLLNVCGSGRFNLYLGRNMMKIHHMLHVASTARDIDLTIEHILTLSNLHMIISILVLYQIFI